MIKVTNTQAARIIGVLLILLSGNAFARSMNTLDKAIIAETARAKAAEGALKATDTAEATARDAAIGTEVTNRNTAIAAETTARDTAIGSAIGTEVTNRNTAIATETTRAKAAEPRVLIPGDSYQGGIVFWVDQTGQHGLIAAKADQSAGVQWYNRVYRSTGSTGDGIGAGAMNTAMIVATQIGDNQSGNFAAPLFALFGVLDDGTTACAGAVSETCYGDWYLPSKVELNLLYAQKSVVGGYANSGY